MKLLNFGKSKVASFACNSNIILIKTFLMVKLGINIARHSQKPVLIHLFFIENFNMSIKS